MEKLESTAPEQTTAPGYVPTGLFTVTEVLQTGGVVRPLIGGAVTIPLTV
jgi:hypothetical protein